MGLLVLWVLCSTLFCFYHPALATDENYSGSRHGGENNFTIINAVLNGYGMKCNKTGCFKERRTIPYSQDAVSFLSNMLDDLKDPNIRSYSSEATDGLSPASKIELEEHPTDGNIITPSINYNYIHNIPEMSDQDASSKDDDSGIKEHSSKELLGKVSPGGPQKDLLDSFDPGYNNRNHKLLLDLQQYIRRKLIKPGNVGGDSNSYGDETPIRRPAIDEMLEQTDMREENDNFEDFNRNPSFNNLPYNRPTVDQPIFDKMPNDFQKKVSLLEDIILHLERASKRYKPRDKKTRFKENDRNCLKCDIRHNIFWYPNSKWTIVSTNSSNCTKNKSNDRDDEKYKLPEIFEEIGLNPKVVLLKMVSPLSSKDVHAHNSRDNTVSNRIFSDDDISEYK